MEQGARFLSCAGVTDAGEGATAHHARGGAGSTPPVLERSPHVGLHAGT
jgi:hypothetical protein